MIVYYIWVVIKTSLDIDENKIAYIDLGTHNENSVDYPIIEKR